MQTRTLSYIIAIILLLIAAIPATAGDTKPSRALLLYSYHPGFPTFYPAIKGLRAVFDANNVKLDVEFMDTKRFYDDSNFDNFTQLLGHKLDNLPKYDVLIVSDDNGLAYAAKHSNDLFKNIPIVFMGINNEKRARELASKNRMTGVLETVSFGETVGLINLLIPKLKEVVVISDSTPSGQADLDRMKTVMKLRGEDFSVLDLSRAGWKDVPALVQQISPKAAILILSIYRDMNGKTLTFEQGLKTILDNARCPVFHCWEHGIGDGIMGGKIISFEEQGKRAAELAMKILGGANPTSLPIIPGDQANIVVLDQNVMDRFEMDESLVPPNSTILNYKPSFWEQNKVLLIEVGGIIAVLVLIISSLLRANRTKTQAELQIRESEERYRRYLEGAPDGLLIFDSAGTIVRSNDAMTELSGYTAEELQGQNAISLLVDRDKERGREGLSELGNIGRHTGDYEMLKKDGQPLFISFHGVVLDDGTVLGYCRDQTELKQIHDALKESESLFRGLLEQAGDAVFACDVTGSLTFVNETACRSLGYTREELLSLKAWDIDPSAAKPEVREAMWQSQPITAESTHIRKDGTVFPVELRMGRIAVGDEDIILAIARDIGKRRENERIMAHDHQANAAMAEVTSVMTTRNKGIQDVANTVYVEAMRLTGSRYGYVGIIEPPDDNLHLYCVTPMPSGFGHRDSGHTVLMKQGNTFPGLWGDSLNTGKAAYTNMATQHPMSRGVPEGHVPIDKFMAVPCIYEGELVGQISLANPDTDFTDEDLAGVTALAQLFALAIYRKRAESELLRSRSLKE